MRNRKGFMLLEVVVSIAIITSALIFVMRVYSTARGAIKRSKELFNYSLLLGEKIFNFEAAPEIEEGGSGGVFSEHKGYSWEFAAVPLSEDSDLEKATLKVYKDKEKGAYSIVTYLNKKK